MEIKIQTIEILKDYHKITGARVSLHDLYFKEIAAYPERPSFFCGKIQQSKTATVPFSVHTQFIIKKH